MPKRSKGLGIYLAVLLALAVVFTMLIRYEKESPSIQYTTIIGYFQQNRVKEFTFDMGTGVLRITKMDGMTEPALEYKVPNVGLFIDNTNKLIFDYNKAHPNAMIVGDYKPIPEMP